MPAVIPSQGLPRFITAEEHKQLTASTPTSFGDIPPVLRHTQSNVQITFDPPIEGLGSDEQGTFVLAFVWPSGAGFTIEYPRITLHAVSRSDALTSVYCQLDESEPSANGGDEDDGEDTEMREMKIIPSDPASVDPIFEALSQCAALHPDPNDEADDANWLDEGESGFSTFDGTNEEELSEVGKAALAHLESLILFPEDEEAEGEEEEISKEAFEDAPEETKTPTTTTEEIITTISNSK